MHNIGDDVSVSWFYNGRTVKIIDTNDEFDRYVFDIEPTLSYYVDPKDIILIKKYEDTITPVNNTYFTSEQLILIWNVVFNYAITIENDIKTNGISYIGPVSFADNVVKKLGWETK